MTDYTFGFATALDIATEAIDRLHSTAHSHHRIIVAEIMGHRAGWLALGAGIAGGADVILIPEIPYDVGMIAEAIRRRSRARHQLQHRGGGGRGHEQGGRPRFPAGGAEKGQSAQRTSRRQAAKLDLAALETQHAGNTLRLAKQLEELTQLESRVTILGYVQRGGTPSAADRLLATRLGSACAELIEEGVYGVMVASRGDGTEPVPLEKVAGKRKTVPLDHPWVQTARHVGTCLGD